MQLNQVPSEGFEIIIEHPYGQRELRICREKFERPAQEVARQEPVERVPRPWFDVFNLTKVATLIQELTNRELIISEFLCKNRRNSTLLNQILRKFPKGGDIHFHLTGGISAHDYLNMALKEKMSASRTTHKFFKPENGVNYPDSLTFEQIDGNFKEEFKRKAELRERTSDQNYSNAFFEVFDVTESVAMHMPLSELLEPVIRDAQSQHILYLEVSKGFETNLKCVAESDSSKINLFTIDDNTVYRPKNTAGTGACALHAILGDKINNTYRWKGNDLEAREQFAADLRVGLQTNAQIRQVMQTILANIIKAPKGEFSENYQIIKKYAHDQFLRYENKKQENDQLWSQLNDSRTQALIALLICIDKTEDSYKDSFLNNLQIKSPIVEQKWEEKKEDVVNFLNKNRLENEFWRDWQEQEMKIQELEIQASETIHSLCSDNTVQESYLNAILDLYYWFTNDEIELMALLYSKGIKIYHKTTQAIELAADYNKEELEKRIIFLERGTNGMGFHYMRCEGEQRAISQSFITVENDLKTFQEQFPKLNEFDNSCPREKLDEMYMLIEPILKKKSSEIFFYLYGLKDSYREGKKLNKLFNNTGEDFWNVVIRLNVDVNRELPLPEFFADLALAFLIVSREAKRVDPRVLGIVISGREDTHSSLEKREAQYQLINYFKSKIGKIPISIHVGELTEKLAHHSYIEDVIGKVVRIVNPDRLAHATSLQFESPYLVQQLKEKKICIESCLTSNERILGTDLVRHTFMNYFRDGVAITLNTDDPGVLGSCLTTEYQKAFTTYPLTYRDLKKLSTTSLRYNFLSGHPLENDKKFRGGTSERYGAGYFPSIYSDCDKEFSLKAALQLKLEDCFEVFEKWITKLPQFQEWLNQAPSNS